VIALTGPAVARPRRAEQTRCDLARPLCPLSGQADQFRGRFDGSRPA
jgi:hypothetical protein